jgi:tripartite motif-containing protein 71
MSEQTPSESTTATMDPAEPRGQTATRKHSATSVTAAETNSRRRRLFVVLGSTIAAAFVLIAAIFVWYLLTHKPITALPGLTEDAVPHYGYSIYGATAPLGVAVSADGSDIYVTESGGAMRILKFDRDGHLVKTLALPSSTGPTHTPLYPAINPVNQHVFVADRLTAKIFEFDADGKYVGAFVANGVSGQFLPLGLAFDPAGRLYVSQAMSKTTSILKFDAKTGTLLQTITSPDPMSFPNGLAIISGGAVVVTDSNNGRALVFDANGHLVTQISSGSAPADLGLPRGVAIDSQGHLDIVDATNQGVRVYKLAGSTVTFVGSLGDQGIGDGLFEYPNGAAADQRAHLYVTDRGNNRVEVWSY